MNQDSQDSPYNNSEPTHLLAPLKLGATDLKNRLGLGPINPGFFRPDGTATAPVLRFYSDFAEANISLVYIGGVAISDSGRSNSRSLVVSSERDVAGIAQVADLVHKENGRLAVQIMHAGRQTSPIETGAPLIAPSPIPCEYYGFIPDEASGAELRLITQQFAASAKVLTAAGVDVIEIHAAHGYLLSGFMSRHTNKRSDAFGGSVTNRFRLLGGIIDAVRDAADDGTIGVRVNVAERSPIGMSVAELVDGIGPFSESLDFVSVSAGMYTRDPAEDWIIPRRALGEALWRSQSRELRDSLNKPVLLAGNITTIDMADRIIESGDADMVLMVRSLLADPRALHKWMIGEGTSIMPCTELYLCKYHSRGWQNVYCPHNNTLHQELHPRRSRSQDESVTETSLLSENAETPVSGRNSSGNC